MKIQVWLLGDQREKEAEELPRWVSFTMRKIEMGRLDGSVRILNR